MEINFLVKIDGDLEDPVGFTESLEDKISEMIDDHYWLMKRPPKKYDIKVEVKKED